MGRFSMYSIIQASEQLYFISAHLSSLSTTAQKSTDFKLLWAAEIYHKSGNIHLA